jgi:hypothetical protein
MRSSVGSTKKVLVFYDPEHQPLSPDFGESSLLNLRFIAGRRGLSPQCYDPEGRLECIECSIFPLVCLLMSVELTPVSKIPLTCKEDTR